MAFLQRLGDQQAPDPHQRFLALSGWFPTRRGFSARRGSVGDGPHDAVPPEAQITGGQRFHPGSGLCDLTLDGGTDCRITSSVARQVFTNVFSHKFCNGNLMDVYPNSGADALMSRHLPTEKTELVDLYSIMGETKKIQLVEFLSKSSKSRQRLRLHRR